MDTLKGIPEHIEHEFGEAILARDEALVLLGANPGLGPPDLCWLQKAPKSSSSTTSSSTDGDAASGYCHWVLGRDVSSSAAVAAYFALLHSRVEQRTFFQGLFAGGGEVAIQRGFYCCYDPFSRLDLRCELCVPGGVVCGAVDAGGVLHDVTPDMWRRAQVASFLRASLYDPEMRVNGGALQTYDPVPSLAAEAALLGHVEALYRSRVLPAALEALSADAGSGCTPEHLDLVCFALLCHFKRRQRWHAALSFFARLAPSYPAASVYIAAAHRELGEQEVAFGVLAQAVERDPLSAHLLVAMSFACLGAGQLDAASKLARRAARISSSLRPPWLALARVCVKQRAFGTALAALNVVPTPPLPKDELELLHVVQPPASKAVTKPQVTAYEPELATVRQMAAEEASLDGNRILAYLPGAILVNKEPLDAGPWLDVSPNRVTRAVLAAVYAVLQEIVAHLGWDAFLDVRSRVFLMHEEAGTPLSSAPSGQLQQQRREQRQEQQRQQQQQQEGPAPVPQAPPPPPVPKHLQQQSPAAAGGGVPADTLVAQLQTLQLALDSPSPFQQQQQQQQEEQQDGAGPAIAPLSTTPGAPHAAPSAGTATNMAPSPGSHRGAAPPAGGSTGLARSAHHSRSSSRAEAPRSPSSYYATRLQEQQELLAQAAGAAGTDTTGAGQAACSSTGDGAARVHGAASANGADAAGCRAAGGSSASGAADGRGVAGSSRGVAGSSSQQQQPSMEGRVLLLGRRTRSLAASSHAAAAAKDGINSKDGSGGRDKRDSSSGRPAVRTSAFSALPDVEDLSRLGSASKVAPFQGREGITPALWAMVFGGGGGGGADGSSKRDNGSGSGSSNGMQVPEFHMPPTPAGLPRIRTRPLGEATETSTGINAAAAIGRAAQTEWFSAAELQTVNMRSSGTGAAAGLSGAWRFGSVGAVGGASRTGSASMQHGSCHCMAPAMSPAPGSGWADVDCSSSSSSIRHSSSSSSSMRRLQKAGRRIARRLGCGSSHSTVVLHAARSLACSGPLCEGTTNTPGTTPSKTTAGTAAASASPGSAAPAAVTPERSASAGNSMPRTGSLLTRGSGTLPAAGSGAGPLGRLQSSLWAANSAPGTPLLRAGSVGVRSPLLRNLDADREAILGGRLLGDEDVVQLHPQSRHSSSGGAGAADVVVGLSGSDKRLCVRWLDELIIALWHDLQAMMEWKVLDQELRAARGATHAELLLGLAPSQERPTPAHPSPSDAGMRPPQLTSVDWMRRGFLAERLGHSEDARQGYRCSAKLGFNLTAVLALLRLEAAAGAAVGTLEAGQQLAAWHEKGAVGCGVRGPVPEALVCGVGVLGRKVGVEVLREGSAGLGAYVQQAVKEYAKWARTEPQQGQQQQQQQQQAQ